MLTKEDKKYLTENFATKKEFSSVRDGLDLLRDRMTKSSLERFDLKFEVEAMRASDIRVEEKVDKIMSILDGFAGKVADLDQENKFGAVILSRHDIQIHELATATDTAISE